MSGPAVVRGLRAGGRAALVVLAAVLPFEMTDPIARIGPLQISSVEVFLYLALAVWATSLAAGWLWGDAGDRASCRRAPEAHGAVLLWALVLIVSAVRAPAFRPTAVKFAFRSLSGILLYAAAADLLRAPAAATRLVKALVAGALVAAFAMLADGHLPRVTAWLRPFHAQTFEVFGLVRGSGPFQYPNIAAMYLETALPLAFVLGLRSAEYPSEMGSVAAAHRWRLAGTALVILVLLAGILVTASRAGFGTAVVCLGGMGIFLARARQTRRASLAAFAALAVLGLASQLSSSALTLRLRFWKDADWYRASLGPVAGPAGVIPASIAGGESAEVTFELRNLGALTWRRLPPREVALSYHWLDAGSGNLAVFDGQRTALPNDMPPGAGAIIRASVLAPERPGRYVLWWDLVHEHSTWFSERGNPGFRAAVDVRGRSAPPGRVAVAAPPVVTPSASAVAAAPAAPSVVAAPAPSVVVVPSAPAAVPGAGFRFVPSDVIPRRALWGAAFAAWREHPLLGLGPDNFRHLYGRYLGLADPDDRLHANSLYFETMASLGTAGLLALAFLIVAFARATRVVVAAPATRWLALGLGAGLFAVLVHGAFDYFLDFTPTYTLPWLLGGVVVALGRPPEERAA